MKTLFLIFLLTARLTAAQFTVADLAPAPLANLTGQSVMVTIVSNTINRSALETYGMAVFLTNNDQYRAGQVSFLWDRYDYASGAQAAQSVRAICASPGWNVCGVGLYFAPITGVGCLTFSDQSGWLTYSGEGNDSLLYDGHTYRWDANSYLITYTDATYGSITLHIAIPDRASTLILLMVALAVLMTQLPKIPHFRA